MKYGEYIVFCLFSSICRLNEIKNYWNSGGMALNLEIWSNVKIGGGFG